MNILFIHDRSIHCIAVILLIFCGTLSAQQTKSWNGKKCAVVLAYDDALGVHLDNAIPLLDSLNFKGTFYLSGFFPSFKSRLNDWKKIACNGHELGNHTLFHPCEGKMQGREWVNPNYDLNIYTRKRITDEIAMANTLFESLDGKKKRTFAYPCGDTRFGDSSYVEDIKKDFIAARGVEGKIETFNEIDRYRIGSYMIAGQSAEVLIGLVKKAIEQNGLIVFLFHGVGGEHNLNVSIEAHHALLQFLKNNEKEIWIAPMIDVAEFVAAQKK